MRFIFQSSIYLGGFEPDSLAAERPNDIHLSTWVARDSNRYTSPPRDFFLRVSIQTPQAQGPPMKQDGIHVD